MATILMSISGFAQKKSAFTEEDAKQFYRTIQGFYEANPNDSTQISLYFVPIWQMPSDRFHWMYMEAVNKDSKAIIIQRIIEIVPSTSKSFRVFVHKLKDPNTFAGKWANPNYFDGYKQNILGGKSGYRFVKTSDFNYQLNDWTRRKSLECFGKGDRLHFKFLQSDERFYIKQVPAKSTHIIGYEFIKQPTDID